MNMKITMFLAIFMLTSAVLGWPQQIDRPVAMVKLHESEAVTQTQFKKTVEAMEKSLKRPINLDEKKQLLDRVIDEKLIIQAANKERIIVADGDITQLKEQTKSLYAAQLGRTLNDDEFKTMVEQLGYTWDTFLKELAKTIRAQKYLKIKKGSSFENLSPPSDKEISDYFESNRTRFISPEMVRFKQVYINPNLLSTAPEKDFAKKKAQTISREIKAGASIDNYWEIFDEPGRLKIGYLMPGILRRDDEKTKEMYGADFFNAVFALKSNEVSEIIVSKAGYHIILVLEKIPFKVLALDDLVPPQNAMTVRSGIKSLLSKVKEQEAVQKALDELIQELRRQAEIKVYTEYLSW